MRARFLQAASTGQMAEGSVALQRPGRMRIEYDPPVPVLIVADGTWLIYHDRQLNQISYLPLGSTPAGILVEDRIDLDGGGLTITGFSRAAGVIRITIVRTTSPADGSLTLVFSENPLELQQWQRGRRSGGDNDGVAVRRSRQGCGSIRAFPLRRSSARGTGVPRITGRQAMRFLHICYAPGALATAPREPL